MCDIKDLDFEKMTEAEIAAVRNGLDPDSMGFDEENEIEGMKDEN